MKQRFSKLPNGTSPIERQEGIFIPLLALSIVAIFGFLGLAVDGGRLYAVRLSAQSWADATAYATAARLALEVNDFSNIPAATLNAAVNDGRDFARSNIFLNGYDPNRTVPSPTCVGCNVAVAVDLTGNNIGVVITISYNLPLAIMQVVPGISNERLVQVVARADITPALGALVLDASGSMNCPSQTNCDCFPNCDANPNQKFEDLLNVVREAFLNRFDRTRDMISVSMYDKTVSQLVTINSGGGFSSTLSPLQIGAYTNTVSQFDSGNLTLGIVRAWQSVNPSFAANPSLAPFIAVLSDGAPTATCLSPVDSVRSIPLPRRTAWWAPLPPLPPLSINDGSTVSCFWEVLWEGYHTEGPGAQLLRKSGISPLAMAPSYPTVPSPYSWSINQPVFNQPACSTLTFSGWQSPTVAGPNDNGLDEIAKCLRSYRFRDVDGRIYPRNGANNDWRDARIGIPTVANRHWGTGASDIWRQMFFNTAVAQADAIRNRGYAFYSIGLGLPPVSGGGDYNNLANILELKENLLTRIAMPYQGFAPGDPTRFPNWGMSNFVQFYMDQDAQTKGEFFRVTDPSIAGIRAQFEQLTRRVKLRMVQ